MLTLIQVAPVTDLVSREDRLPREDRTQGRGHNQEFAKDEIPQTQFSNRDVLITPFPAKASQPNATAVYGPYDKPGDRPGLLGWGQLIKGSFHDSY